MAIGERRDFLRRNCSAEIRISWESQPPRTVSAECLNLSRTGVRVKAAQAVPTTLRVHLLSDEPGLNREGVIRYCLRQGGAYVIGVEFAEISPSRN
jgi:hypothetical protein